MASVVCAPTLPGTGDGVMMIVGRGTGITVTDVETVAVLPPTSRTVPVIEYVPEVLNTWLTVVLEIAPRSWAVPSPQLTLTLRTASPAGAVAANVNVAGRFTLGAGEGGVITSVRTGASTVTKVETLTTFPELSVTLAAIE